MQIRKMGRTGLKVSQVCLGTMTFGHQADTATSHAIMDAAWERGVFFFDTADMYPLEDSYTDYSRRGLSEQIIGQWITQRGVREQMVLATKARNRMGSSPNDQGLSRKHLHKALHASLKRLQTDYIDLYQVHSPDPDTPIEETLEALSQMVRLGMVRYIGCSNFAAWQLAEALWASDKHGYSRFDCVQPRYNLLFRAIEDELLPLCRSQGVGVIAYNPLAGGMLTGRYASQRPEEGNRFSMGGSSGELYRKRYWNQTVLQTVTHLHQTLQACGYSLTHAALAWVLQQEGLTSAILGASSPKQLIDSLGALQVQLDPDTLALLDAAWFDLPKVKDPSVALR